MANATQSMPSIAIISPYPPIGKTDIGRGLAGYSKRLANSLVQLGCSVTVLADRQEKRPTQADDDGVQVWRTWREGFKAVSDIRAAVDHLQPDLVHFQHELFVFGRGYRSLVPLRLLGALRKHRIITTLHGVASKSDLGRELRSYSPRTPVPVVRLAYGFIMRFLVRKSALIVTHSSAIAKSLSEYTNPKAIEIIPLAIPERSVRFWSRSEALDALGLSDRSRAVFFGYVLPYKGVETLVAAAPALAAHGVEVLVAGSDGGDARPTHKMIAPSSNEVKRLGFVPESLLPALFAVADVMVFPYSVGLSSSAPLALAIGYDVPVVVSDVPTLAEDLKMKDATFRASDPVSLTQTLLRVLKEPTIQRQLLERFKLIRFERSPTAIAKRTLDVYRTLLPSRSPE